MTDDQFTALLAKLDEIKRMLALSPEHRRQNALLIEQGMRDDIERARRRADPNQLAAAQRFGPLPHPQANGPYRP